MANFSELNSKGLYRSSGKKTKIVVLCLRPSQNVKKCPEKRGARANFPIRQSKSDAFLPFSLPSPSSLLQVRILHSTPSRTPCASTAWINANGKGNDSATQAHMSSTKIALCLCSA